jgi:hypothetical protein
MSEPGEFALGPAVSPGRIRPGQTHHEVADLITDRWAAGPMGVSSLFRD